MYTTNEKAALNAGRKFLRIKNAPGKQEITQAEIDAYKVLTKKLDLLTNERQQVIKTILFKNSVTRR